MFVKAVKPISGLSASRPKLRDREILCPGMKADISPSMARTSLTGRSLRGIITDSKDRRVHVGPGVPVRLDAKVIDEAPRL